MTEDKHQRLKGFLKQCFQDDGLKVELTSPLAIRYSYYHKMKFEVGSIIKTLGVLKTLETKKEILNTLPFNSDQKILIRQSLWYAVVVNYGKFFSSKGKDEASVGHIKLQSKDCYKNATSSQLLMHENIIEVRNKLIAHGTKNVHEEVVPYLYLYLIPGTNELECSLGINAIGLISFSSEDLEKTYELVKQLAVYLNSRLEKISDKLFEEVDQKTAQEWWDLANTAK